MYNIRVQAADGRSKSFAENLAKINPELSNYLVGLKGAEGTMKGYGVHLVGATIKTVALQAASMALNAALTWGVSLAIQGIIAGVQALWKLVPTTEHLKKSLEETAQALSDIRSEKESLNDELKTTEERIAELEAKGTLSFTDEAELNRLNKENAALKTKIELLDIEAKKTREKNQNNFNKLIDKEETNTSNKSWTSVDYNGNSEQYKNITDKEKLLELAEIYDKVAKSKEDYLDVRGFSHSIEDVEKEITDFSSVVQEYQGYLDDLYQDGFDYNSADEATKQNIDYANEIIDRYMVLVGKTDTVWERAYNSDRFSEARTAIEELANAGNLTAESLQNLYNQGGNVKEFIDYMLSLNTVDWKTMLGDKFTDVAGEDGIVSLDEALKAMSGDTELASKIMGLFANELNKVEDAAEGATSAVKSFTDIADSFQDGYDAIVDAQKDIEEQNYLSADSVKALEKAGLSDYLKETEYGYLLVNDALNTYLEAQGKEYKDALDTAISQASSLATMQDAVAAGYKNDASGLATYLRVLGAANNAMARNEFKNNLISKGFTVTEAHRMWMSSQQRIAADQAQSEYIAAANAIDVAIKNQKTYEMVRKTAQNDTKYSSGSKSGKTEAEKYFEALKYKLDTNKITQEQYLKDLDWGYKHFYNKTADYLEDYAKYSQEVYDGFKDMYKEDLEAQKEAWEEKKDAVSEYYDNLREQIENAHDEEDYEKEQSEKRKEIFDLDMQIAELMRDGSEKAKARIAELEEERLKVEEDLRDFETDKARENELSRLEKEQKAEEKKIQDKIDGIQGQLDKLDEDTISVRNAIISYARSKGVTLDFAYASGTRSSVGGFGRINEKGIEMISAPDGNGNYVNLMPGSYVFSAKATEFLWKLATEHSLPQAMYNSIAKSIKTQSSTPSVNIAQPITVTMGDIIIQGNADKQTVANIKRQQDNTVRMVLQRIKELQK